MKPIGQIWWRLAALLALVVLMGCQIRADEPDRYAELRTDSLGRTQVLIRADVWRGIFTIHGFGGYVHNIYYWTTLKGEGTDYHDPVFNVNGLASEQFIHRGTITVDRKNKRVAIDLKRVVSKPGEPEKLEPSPANGTYPIKKTNREPFMKPE